MRTSELPVGTKAASPFAEITEEHGRLARTLGGYTHPMFDERPYPRESLPFERRPVPGELTLFLLGGLAEQTGIFDDSVIALVGLDEVRFMDAAMVGDEIGLELEVTARRPTSRGDKVIVEFAWRAFKRDGREVLTAVARMLCRAGD